MHSRSLLKNCARAFTLGVLLLLWFVCHSVVVAESPGPSSRRTGLAITEIMHHPSPTGDGRNREFIELYNSEAIDEDLSGYHFAGSVQFVFPKGTVLQPGSYLVVARVPADVHAAYGITNVVGPYTGYLARDAGRVRLENEFGAGLLEVRYETANPWPIAAAGAGHSMVLANPSWGEANPKAWTQSLLIGGSPGGPEPMYSERLGGVFINEFMVAAPGVGESFVELYNHNNEPKDLSGCWLSADAATLGFQIPNGTTLPPRGRVSFTATQLGFEVKASGGWIYLLNQKRLRVLDAVEYEAQEPGVASGRYPDGSVDWYRLASATRGAPNVAPLHSPVVINEIMYHAISGSERDQYVELLNRSTNAVDLGNWAFVSGISFKFPAKTILPPHGLIVVAKDAKHLRSTHPNLTKQNCFGNFGGTLKRGGERLALAKPVLLSDGTTQLVAVNEVTYHDGGQWGLWSDGGGSSMELIDPDANTRWADNWRDSDESGKSSWSTIMFTGGIGQTLAQPASDSLQISLLGEGECLLDDAEVLSSENLNLVLNPGFTWGMTNWYPQGAYDQSSIDPSGYGRPNSLHIRAGSRGDPGANKIRSAEFPPLAPGEKVTIRANARWLRGWPELLLRLHGGGAEAFGRLSVPGNLGTPGLPNSRSMPAGPAIAGVMHQPVLPEGREPVVVTAQADDSKGLKSITLRYRVDPSMTFNDVPMNDDGKNGDAVAGDGVFSATIPGQTAGTLVAFHVAAINLSGVTNTFPKEVFPKGPVPRLFPTDSLSRECLVRIGEEKIPGRFASYRMWLTQANRDRWIARDRLSNADMDVTFVYNDERVVYNAGAQTAGSPWHTDQMATGPDGTNRFDYVVHLPKDNAVLGESDFNIVIPGNGDGANSSDLSALSEPVSLLIFRELGLPSLHRRFVHFFVNGSERSHVSGLPGHFVYEDVQQPNHKLLGEWFKGDSHGQLFKIEDWFEFTNNAATLFENKDADLLRRVIPGTAELSMAPYRFMWRLRGLQAGDSGNNYGRFFELVQAVSPSLDSNAPVNFSKVSEVVDLEEWFRVIACQRTVGNWDSYGWERGKNCYLYAPVKGRLLLIPWDVDATLALGGREPDSDLFESADPRIAAMLEVLAIKRMYLRAFQDILDGPLRPGRMEAAFDIRAAAFAANGTSYDPSLTVSNKAYLVARRAHIARELAKYQAPFSLSPAAASTVTGTNVTLHGTASPAVATLRVNLKPVELTWRTPTNWSVTLPVRPGTNTFELTGLDRLGKPSTVPPLRTTVTKP